MDNIQQIEWWTPEARPAYIFWTEDGGREEGPMLEADEVICDCCNGDVLTNPAPLVGGNALCDDCFKEMFGISVEEAAQQAGVTINRTDGGEEESADRCVTCSGTGLISCSECEGEGRVPASGCGEEAGGWADRCDDCSGTGLVSCPDFQNNNEEA